MIFFHLLFSMFKKLVKITLAISTKGDVSVIRILEDSILIFQDTQREIYIPWLSRDDINSFFNKNETLYKNYKLFSNSF